MSQRDEARDLLAELGYTEYEADALVTLLEESPATASELSDRSSLPRSRVYDVMDDLADRGFVEVCEGEPREFRATPPEAITASLADRYEAHIEHLEDSLAALEGDEGPDFDRCRVWSVRGRDQALSRGQQLIAGAADSVTMYVSDELFESACHDHLTAALDAGVDLTVLAGEARDWYAETLPRATVADPPAWLETDGLVRVLVVDGHACQVATRWQASPTSRPVVQSVLATGEANGFVLAIEAALQATIA